MDTRINTVGSPAWISARYNVASGGLDLGNLRSTILKRSPKPEDAVQVSVSDEARALNAALMKSNDLTKPYVRE